ncbi:hypothetical protein BpHYR1_020777 [Brachionus plicatilis]|uniref:Uncharacterized protein n=1 Tax=Brachionus plicatilis TaxID=10195 RepID=A0A3M7SG93_BRAPC|nr:hypothetical protein BpHYR1_020777 [Brachionus plicatilis]
MLSSCRICYFSTKKLIIKLKNRKKSLIFNFDFIRFKNFSLFLLMILGNKFRKNKYNITMTVSISLFQHVSNPTFQMAIEKAASL